MDARTETHGTPLAVSFLTAAGASCRSPSEYSMRDAVYRAEFRHDATAVSTTMSMICADAGMPIVSSTV